MPPKFKHELTTIGWLLYLRDPAADYWEYFYLKFLHRNLTHNWYIIQFGSDLKAKQLWWEICQVLELDRKSQRDLLILAHTGAHGRAHANRILWKLMSDWALQVPYRDLSNLVSHEVNIAHQSLGRPPREHKDLDWWTWQL